jgi:TPR repeat protein
MTDQALMFRVGLAHELGRGLAHDRAEAVHWYRRAASLGYERAAQRLRTLGEDR